jgi:transcriptional regulator with XRE-family HTH domain
MNQIERLRSSLVKRFPGLAIEIDAPANERGSWFLDVRRDGGVPPVVVEWRSDRGFGISTPDGDDYGAGPDEVYTNARAAHDRVVALVLSGGRAEPPLAVRLTELRQLRGLSQEELAERAGMGQANLSRIESREDVLISTLARILSAMGASLSIHAHFPKGKRTDLQIIFPPAASSPGASLTVQVKDQPATGRGSAASHARRTSTRKVATSKPSPAATPSTKAASEKTPKKVKNAARIKAVKRQPTPTGSREPSSS